MDKRTFLALLLTALVIVLTPMLFRTGQPRPATGRTGSSAGATASSGSTAAAAQTSAQPAAVQPGAQRPAALPATPARPADTTIVQRPNGVYAFASPGAAPAYARLTNYRALGTTRSGPVTLVNPPAAATLGQPLPALLRYRLVMDSRDTIALDTIAFQSAPSPNGVTFTSTSTPRIAITYTYTEAYLTEVRGTVAPAGAGGVPGQLLIDLPQGFHSQEADTVDDLRHLAYSYKLAREDVKSVAFSKLDSMLIRTDSGPMSWVAARDKYFVLAVVAPTTDREFAAARLRGGHRAGKVAVTAYATAVQPLRDNSFGFELYMGPQSWQALRAVGHDLENVNPYGGWFPGVQPFTTIVMRILLWMRQTFRVGYGWVLIIFGVVVRLLLWPLNQSAMRSSLKMQRIQPELMEVQKKYKGDPEKQREAIMRLYQEHGMSPFSQLTGCLPMLLPMPVLFALYYVFQNTIELRGVSFLWIPDLALKDPLFITPIVMGITMFLLSWIGMRAAPPNPQTKMMSYMMPAVMTVVFINLASGLNLYYAVQNIAALPQQWFIARERAKAGVSSPSTPKTGGRRSA